MTDLYKSCRLCPRNCGVDRLSGETGFCGETSALRISSAVIHRGEEPPITGKGGSGTIFVSGCNLGCSFCQNYQISQSGKNSGKIVIPEEFARICAALQEKGAENINIVTGSHAIPSLIDGLKAARKTGVPPTQFPAVQIPVLWNCSAYETPEALGLLREYVDVYLPDLKTLDSEISGRFFNAPDYPETAANAIKKMIENIKSREQKTENNEQRLTERDQIRKNKIIIRHLVLPGYLDSTQDVLRWYKENAEDHALLSLMTQYTPIPNRNKIMPKRHLSPEEYETVLYWLKELDIEEGFCQELVTGSDWLPDFTRSNPFPSELSVPVWSFISTSRI